MRVLALVFLVAWALVLAAGADARSDTFRPVKCGEITVRKNGNDHTYKIKVFQARLVCTTAQVTMSRSSSTA